MSHLPNTLNLIGQLLSYPELSYPEPRTVELAERLCAELRDELSEASPHAVAFLAFARQSDHRDVEEVFTRTFDINPTCALEVGWHLFGEEYTRGLFLVRMREELRKYHLRESVELPDHIAHALAVTAAMPADEATRFVCACLLPAVVKMNQAMSGKESPYRHILSCLESVLMTQWGERFEAANEASQSASAAPTGGVDLLHAFPVSDAPVDCESCSRASENAVPGDAIPRETQFPGPTELADNAAPGGSANETENRINSNSQSPLATHCELSPTPTQARKR